MLRASCFVLRTLSLQRELELERLKNAGPSRAVQEVEELRTQLQSERTDNLSIKEMLALQQQQIRMLTQSNTDILQELVHIRKNRDPAGD